MSKKTQMLSHMNPDPKKPTETKKEVDGRFDTVELLIFTLAAVLIAMCFLFRHSVVEGGSMDKTLAHGEHLIISSLFYTPKAGDIVVFEDYTKGQTLKKPLIKRVIATEGQTIHITEQGRVSVNGVYLEEDYVYTDGYDRHGAMELTVPEGCLFVMGDHRNNSADSRDFGVIREETILGRVLLRIYPFHKLGTVA